ncbi:MAG TPA: serine hydrolase [Aggregatilineaceae bacterium]|nr:serine hydrolase [Aggregatilineaceae bacterium]
MLNRRFSAILLVVALVLPALASPSSARAQDGGNILWPTEGWSASTPEQQGMSSEKLAGLWPMLVGGTSDSSFGIPSPAGNSTYIHTALVIRHGNAVLDASVYPFSNDQPHEMYSTTKGVVSTLVGIAIDQGYIKSTAQSIWDFFPKSETANMDDQKAAITLHHLLTHTSGLNIGIPTATGQWDTGGKTYTQYVLDSPMETAPGSTYKYQDGNADLVSEILQEATGMTAFDFAQQNLFGSLGITDAAWAADPEGVNWGGWGLAISGYDLAKLGYLFLHRGMWDGKQIVSSDWVTASINDQLEPLQPHFWEGYSNYWYDGPIGFWFNEPEGKNAQYRGFAAFGWGMQILVVVPDLDLIMVTTGDMLSASLFTALTSYIIPSIESDQALSDNPTAYEQLQAAVTVTEEPTPSAAISLPADAQTISGKTYTLADNLAGWKSLSVTFSGNEASLKIGFRDTQLEFPVGLDGVFRVSSVGMPVDPIFWSHPNVPVAIKGTWLDDQTFSMELWDLMGNQGFVITIPVNTLEISVVPVLFQEMAMTIQATPQP